MAAFDAVGVILGASAMLMAACLGHALLASRPVRLRVAQALEPARRSAFLDLFVTLWFPVAFLMLGGISRVLASLGLGLSAITGAVIVLALYTSWRVWRDVRRLIR